MKKKLFLIYKKGVHITLSTINILDEFFGMLAGRNATDGKKSFTIFQHPDGRIYAVKDGFNWIAFFLSPFWVIYRKLWIHVAIVWIIGALLSLVIPIPGIAFGLIYGFKGNELVRKNLSNRGFKNKKDIKAKNPDDALAIFYDEENEK